MAELKSAIVAQMRSTKKSIVEALSYLKIKSEPVVPVADLLCIYVYLLQASNESDLVKSNQNVAMSNEWPFVVSQVIQPDFVSTIMIY